MHQLNGYASSNDPVFEDQSELDMLRFKQNLNDAVQKGDIFAVRRLLSNKRSQDLSLLSPSNEPLMLVALKQGHDEIINILVENGADLNHLDSNGKHILHHLACTSKLDVIRFVINNGGDVNITDSENKRPLHYAAAVNNLKSAKALIENGATQDCTDNFEITPLMEAAKHGSLEVCKYLISQGVSINDKDISNTTALQYACKGGYLSTVQVLCESGAAFSQSNLNESDIMIAVEARAPNIVEYLIEQNANVSLINRRKMTALHIAAKVGSLKCAEILSTFTDILDAQDRKGLTPLMVAARHGQSEVMSTLIKAGAQTLCQDQQLMTALHHAALQGHLPCVMLMLKNGARIEQPGQNGNLPIMLASHGGHADIVKLMLNVNRGNQYWNINTSNHDHMTALHLAVEKGHYQCAEYLLQEGADPGRQNRNGDTPTILAARRGHHRILQLLVQFIVKSPDPDHCLNEVNLMKKTALHTAAKTGSSECVQVLLSANANPDIPDMHGKTALINAAEQGYEAVVDRLLWAKADVNMKTDEGWTALHLAAQNNSVSIVSMLLESGADSNASVRLNGITACLLASTRGHYGVLKVLLKKGCNVNQADFCGMTALHKVARGGHGPCARLLVYHGANIDCDTTYGLVPAMVAVTEGHRRVLRVLLEANCNITKIDPLKTKQNKKFTTILEMLFIAGCTIHAEDLSELMSSSQLPSPLVANNNLLQRVLDWAGNPRPLKQTCRLKIRKVLGYDINKKIDGLQLPVFLRDYVLLKELRDIVIQENIE